MQILVGCLAFGMLACAVMAIRASRLVVSSLWLAGLSVLLAGLIYAMGASRVAVIELSVGAGLVTVLLIFVVGIAGDEAAGGKPLVPRAVSWGLGLVVLALLGWFTVPLVAPPPPPSQPSLASLLWKDRALDVLIQVVLIFCGVMGILGLLSEAAIVTVAGRQQAAQAPPAAMDSEPVKKEGRVQP
jgi:NADH:ubiquinone oxidoreductase subunit 6 (subunit J)